MSEAYVQQPICVDDYGEEVYRCRYSNELLWSRDAVPEGPLMANFHKLSKPRYFMGTNEASKAAKRFSVAAFNESEANCNTCKNLIRVPHKREMAQSLLYGKCAKQVPAGPYVNYVWDGVFPFPPDDPMHMPCWEPRERK